MKPGLSHRLSQFDNLHLPDRLRLILEQRCTLWILIEECLHEYEGGDYGYEEGGGGQQEVDQEGCAEEAVEGGASPVEVASDEDSEGGKHQIPHGHRVIQPKLLLEPVLVLGVRESPDVAAEEQLLRGVPQHQEVVVCPEVIGHHHHQRVQHQEECRHVAINGAQESHSQLPLLIYLILLIVRWPSA